MRLLLFFLFIAFACPCLAQVDLQKQTIRGEWAFVGIKKHPFAEEEPAVNVLGKHPARITFFEDGTWRANYNLFKAVFGNGSESGSYSFQYEPKSSQFKIKKMHGATVVVLGCDVYANKRPQRIYCFPDGDDIVIFQLKK